VHFSRVAKRVSISSPVAEGKLTYFSAARFPDSGEYAAGGTRPLFLLAVNFRGDVLGSALSVAQHIREVSTECFFDPFCSSGEV